jgi:hypothetical protein
MNAAPVTAPAQSRITPDKLHGHIAELRIHDRCKRHDIFLQDTELLTGTCGHYPACHQNGTGTAIRISPHGSVVRLVMDFAATAN